MLVLARNGILQLITPAPVAHEALKHATCDANVQADTHSASAFVKMEELRARPKQGVEPIESWRVVPGIWRPQTKVTQPGGITSVHKQVRRPELTHTSRCHCGAETVEAQHRGR